MSEVSTDSKHGDAMSGVLAGGRVPFHRHVRVELRKQLDTRAGLWILIAIALITIGSAILPLWIYEPEQLTWRAFIDFSSGGWGILLPFIGVLAATSEWTQRTGLTTFALEPRRTLVNIAKLVSSLLLGTVVVAASFAAAAVVNSIGIAVFDGDGAWALDAGYVLGLVATLAIYVSLGVGLGLALLSTPLAIVAFIMLPLAVSVLAMIPALADLVPWLDLSSATLPLLSGAMSGEEWAQLGTVVAVWCLVPLGLGLWRTARREIA